MDFAAARQNMIDCQIKTFGVTGDAVLNAFATTPREQFFPDSVKNLAYTDQGFEFPEGRPLLPPMVYAKLVEALQPAPKKVVLEIGTGCGYGTTILSQLVMTVITTDSNAESLDAAQERWNQLEACNIVTHQGDMVSGVPEHAPYDIIFVNGAFARIPESLAAQLSDQGILAGIHKESPDQVGHAVIARKSGPESLSYIQLFETESPYLPGFEPEKAFVF